MLHRVRPALQLRAIECEPEAAFAGLRSGELDLVIQAESSRVPPQSDPAYHRTLLVTDVSARSRAGWAKGPAPGPLVSGVPGSIGVRHDKSVL